MLQPNRLECRAEGGRRVCAWQEGVRRCLGVHPAVHPWYTLLYTPCNTPLAGPAREAYPARQGAGKPDEGGDGP